MFSYARRRSGRSKRWGGEQNSCAIAAHKVPTRWCGRLVGKDVVVVIRSPRIPERRLSACGVASFLCTRRRHAPATAIEGRRTLGAHRGHRQVVTRRPPGSGLV
jgi:hypothetical protein